MYKMYTGDVIHGSYSSQHQYGNRRRDVRLNDGADGRRPDQRPDATVLSVLYVEHARTYIVTLYGNIAFLSYSLLLFAQPCTK